MQEGFLPEIFKQAFVGFVDASHVRIERTHDDEAWVHRAVGGKKQKTYHKTYSTVSQPHMLKHYDLISSKFLSK